MPPTNYREKVQACGFMEPAKARPPRPGPWELALYTACPRAWTEKARARTQGRGSLSPVLVERELGQCKTDLFLAMLVMRSRSPELFRTGRCWPSYLIL